MITKVDNTNIKDFYSKTSGNLYVRPPYGFEFHVLDGGFTIDECLNAMSNGVEFIYISGRAIY